MNIPVETLGGVPSTLTWRVRYQTLFLWEIDTEALAPLVPPSLDPVEVRPGASIFAIECLHYYTGHFRPGYPEFVEMVLTAAVQPDLSIDMPVPRFCMHAISVVSDAPEFVEQEGRLLFTPTELIPGLRMQYSEDGGSVDVFDGENPIVSCRNTHTSPVYAPKTMFGQYYTNTRGLQQGLWRWDGEMFEHMKKGDAGKCYPHPFFKTMDLGRIRGCYRQMAAKPNIVNNVRFYHLGQVSDRLGKRRGVTERQEPGGLGI